jgi:hypothetical protein
MIADLRAGTPGHVDAYWYRAFSHEPIADKGAAMNFNRIFPHIIGGSPNFSAPDSLIRRRYIGPRGLFRNFPDGDICHDNPASFFAGTLFPVPLT